MLAMLQVVVTPNNPDNGKISTIESVQEFKVPFLKKTNPNIYYIEILHMNVTL